MEASLTSFHVLYVTINRKGVGGRKWKMSDCCRVLPFKHTLDQKSLAELSFKPLNDVKCHISPTRFSRTSSKWPASLCLLSFIAFNPWSIFLMLCNYSTPASPGWSYQRAYKHCRYANVGFNAGGFALQVFPRRCFHTCRGAGIVALFTGFTHCVFFYFFCMSKTIISPHN